MDKTVEEAWQEYQTRYRDYAEPAYDSIRDDLRACFTAGFAHGEAREREAWNEVQEVLELCDDEGHRARAFNAVGLPEDHLVYELCERFGYGAVMDSAARQWFAKDDDGAFVVGSCAATVRQAKRRIRQRGEK